MATTKTTVTCNTQLALSIEANETNTTVTFGDYQKKFDENNYPKEAGSFSNFTKIMQNITVTKCIKKDGADEYAVECMYDNGVAFQFEYVLAKRNPEEIALNDAIKTFEQKLNASFYDVINTNGTVIAGECISFPLFTSSTSLTSSPIKNIRDWNRSKIGGKCSVSDANPLRNCCVHFANLTQTFIRTCSVLLRNHLVQMYFVSNDKHDKNKSLAENIAEFKKLDFVAILLNNVLHKTFVLQYPIINLFVKDSKIDFTFKYANVDLAELFKKLNVAKFVETVFDELVAPNNELLKFGKPYFAIRFNDKSAVLAGYNPTWIPISYYIKLSDVRNDVRNCGFQFAHIYPCVGDRTEITLNWYSEHERHTVYERFANEECHIHDAIHKNTNARIYTQHCDKIDLEQHLSV